MRYVRYNENIYDALLVSNGNGDGNSPSTLQRAPFATVQKEEVFLRGTPK